MKSNQGLCRSCWCLMDRFYGCAWRSNPRTKLELYECFCPASEEILLHSSVSIRCFFFPTFFGFPWGVTAVSHGWSTSLPPWFVWLLEVGVVPSSSRDSSVGASLQASVCSVRSAMMNADFPVRVLTQWHRMCVFSHSSGELDILSSQSV